MKLTERQLRSIVRKTISENKKRTLMENIAQATQKFSDEMDLFLAAMETDPARAKELLGNVQNLLSQLGQEVESKS
jgi:hypothetical protein